VDHSALGDNISKKEVSDMIQILDKAKIPDSILDKTIKIATWNIQNFGGSRKPLSLHHIAEVLSRFELTAITELKESTQDLEKVMKILGPYWKVIYSDSNMDQKGNKERIGYLYDGRVIEFTGLAAEADPIRENFATKEQLEKSIRISRVIKNPEKNKLIKILCDMKTSKKLEHHVEVEHFVQQIKSKHKSKRLEYIVKRMRKVGEFRSTHSWWRSPYLVSFKAGNFDFVMLAAHVKWGGSGKIDKERRKGALEKLADWVKIRREQKNVKDKDIIVLGDFNIPKNKNNQLWNAIRKHGLDTHSNILGDKHGSTLSKGKRYDQIFYHSENKHRIQNGGIVNLYPENVKKPYKKMTKNQFKYQISDHFPLWIQINVERN
jgi:endonuclease/exonuclease/phosphatase family metal-dependent hydrolase